MVRTLLGETGCSAGRYEDAARLFEQITLGDDYVEFLILPGYQLLTRRLREAVAA